MRSIPLATSTGSIINDVFLLEHFNTTLNMSRKGKEKGDDASGLWQLVAEMQAIANFTNKWPIGKSQMCVTM